VNRMRHAVVLALPLMALLGALSVLLFLGTMMTSNPVDQTEQGAQACTTRADAGPTTVSLDDAQVRNARIIVATGERMGVPERGLAIAIATAMQESTLRNLDWGDRDSVGLFQQRPSSGWGTVAQLTDPPAAARKFYAALMQVPGWTAMPLTVAAQTVQRSAFPFAYARWESLATSLVDAVAGSGLRCNAAVGSAVPAGTSGTIARMLRVALAQQGDPYVWGATGPDAFDCSGLVVYAWRQAGYQLTVRTAAQMYTLSTPVAAGQERPGDLYFGSFGTRVAGAGHVMIVVRPGIAVQAPSAGRDVVVTRYDARAPGWRLGRLPSSALSPLATAA
jgi:cell wall-associated NlpC family hydrolase